MLKEFKEFAMRGNVLDMAVGIIIGAAFGKIITSLVADVIMPPIGLILGKVDFSSLFSASQVRPTRRLSPQRPPARHHQLRCFPQHRNRFPDRRVCDLSGDPQVNRWKKPAPVAAPTTKECPYCFTAIPIKATRCPNCTSDSS